MNANPLPVSPPRVFTLRNKKAASGKGKYGLPLIIDEFLQNLDEDQIKELEEALVPNRELQLAAHAPSKGQLLPSGIVGSKAIGDCKTFERFVTQYLTPKGSSASVYDAYFVVHQPSSTILPRFAALKTPVRAPVLPPTTSEKKRRGRPPKVKQEQSDSKIKKERMIKEEPEYKYSKPQTPLQHKRNRAQVSPQSHDPTKLPKVSEGSEAQDDWDSVLDVEEGTARCDWTETQRSGLDSIAEQQSNTDTDTEYSPTAFLRRSGRKPKPKCN